MSTYSLLYWSGAILIWSCSQ